MSLWKEFDLHERKRTACWIFLPKEKINGVSPFCRHTIEC